MRPLAILVQTASQIVHYDEQQALGAPVTFYLITSKPEASDPEWAASDLGAAARAFNEQVDRCARCGQNGRLGRCTPSRTVAITLIKPIDVAEFTSSVEYSKSPGDVWIDSMVHVRAYRREQKAFSQAAQVRSYDETVWT